MSWKKTLTLALGGVTIGAAAFAGSITGKVTATGQRSNAEAVVYVDQIPGKTFPAPSEPAEMDQTDLTFSPHVLPVLVGTTVDFHNSDSVAHNVFTVDQCADMFDLGTWPQGESRSHTFDQPCAAVILCNVHPEMEAYVVAVPTPYFAVTGADGSYTIDGVPDGSYTVKAWHSGMKEASQAVSVAGEAQADFVLKK
jgi:plastocyanin